MQVIGQIVDLMLKNKIEKLEEEQRLRHTITDFWNLIVLFFYLEEKARPYLAEAAKYVQVNPEAVRFGRFEVIEPPTFQESNKRYHKETAPPDLYSTPDFWGVHNINPTSAIVEMYRYGFTYRPLHKTELAGDYWLMIGRSPRGVVVWCGAKIVHEFIEQERKRRIIELIRQGKKPDVKLF